jgi:glycosyltransferase involved in cell wall biosynthesis
LKLRLALVAPHLYLRQEFSNKVIFSPGELLLELASTLAALGVEVTVYAPGKLKLPDVKVVYPETTELDSELAQRGYGFGELFAKHTLTAITLARQLQGEVVAQAFAAANRGEHDLVHIYMNEEELALVFAGFCSKPVVFNHHEPFNFLFKYRSIFPKYAAERNFISISQSQRASLPKGNWVGNVYHGLPIAKYKFSARLAAEPYVAYLGRIIEPKGVHLAVKAAKRAGVKLKIAGKHYSEAADSYWQQLQPEIDGVEVQYVGFISSAKQKQDFLGNAKALIVPSIWEEPFGLVVIEALACGTPVIGLNNGALSELIRTGENGILIEQAEADSETIARLAQALQNVGEVSRGNCRRDFEERFTSERMAQGYLDIYQNLLAKIAV